LTNSSQLDFFLAWGSDLPTRRHAEESRPTPTDGRTMSSISPAAIDALTLPAAAPVNRPLSVAQGAQRLGTFGCGGGRDLPTQGRDADNAVCSVIGVNLQLVGIIP
jgi:hypothetical protein